MKDIVSIMFGDSILYGVGDTEEFGWANRIKKSLSSNNFLFNLGIPGQNSTDILNRFESEFKNRFNNEDKFNIIFSFGIKDALILNEDLNHLKVFKSNINKLIEISKKYSNNIYFIGLIMPNIDIRKNYNLSNVSLVDDTLKDICNENNVGYIALKDKIKNEDLFDGLHPNNIGHKKISEIVLKEIFKAH